MSSKTYKLPNGKEAVFEYDVCGIGKVTLECMDELMGMIADAPSIDIVRCKECRHWIGETEHYEDKEYKACWQLCGQYMNSEFWCKYGEREGE